MKSFKKIKGFENYAVSYVGIVMNLKTKKLLKPEKIKGYLRVSLSREGVVKRFLVHRLVASYYLENKENKSCVNHKNGDKEWNHVNNLEWCSYSENENHSYKVLNKKNPSRKLSDLAIIDIRKNCVKGNTKNVILFPGNVNIFMQKYKVDRKTILNVLNNKYYV
jgi:hypothetical protein